MDRASKAEQYVQEKERAFDMNRRSLRNEKRVQP